MSAWIRQSRPGQGLFALLLLCALAIRVAIPTGFMPTATPQGIVVGLCNGHGTASVFIPIERDGGQPAQHGKTAEGPCAFAAGLGGDLPEPALADLPAPLVLAASFPATRAIADLTVHRLAAPPPPSQAPPARA